jgi:hypothetical protein
MVLRRQMKRDLETMDPQQAANAMWRRENVLTTVRQLFSRHNYRTDYQRALHILGTQHNEARCTHDAGAWSQCRERADRIVGELRSRESGREALPVLASLLAEMPWHSGAHEFLLSVEGPDVDEAMALHRRFQFRHEGLIRHAAITLPLALTCDPADGSLVVADRNAGAVFRLAPIGTQCEILLNSLADPRSLNFAPDGTLWVAEMLGQRLWSIGPGGEKRSFPLSELLPNGSPDCPLSIVIIDNHIFVLLTTPYYTDLALARLSGSTPMRLVAWEPVDIGTIWSLGTGPDGLVGYFRPVGPVLRSPDGFRWEPFSHAEMPAPMRNGCYDGEGLFVLSGDSVIRLDRAGNLVWRASLAYLLGQPSSPTDCGLCDTPQGRRLYIADTNLAAIHAISI